MCGFCVGSGLITGVGLSLLSRSCRLGAVLRLDLDKVGGFLFSVKGGPRGDDAAHRMDAEQPGVSTLILQDGVVDLDGTKKNHGCVQNHSLIRDPRCAVFRGYGSDFVHSTADKTGNRRVIFTEGCEREILTMPWSPESKSMADT